MGCCSPESRKLAAEQEKKVNEKGTESIPWYMKVVFLGISIISLALVFL
ncbi:MAG TPA: hypothetical protein VEY51_15245 [Chondromyces sp.]|nr:hypothetical protein [Chondromyces sp.]